MGSFKVLIFVSSTCLEPLSVKQVSLSTYLFSCLPIYLPVSLVIYPFTCLFIILSLSLSLSFFRVLSRFLCPSLLWNDHSSKLHLRIYHYILLDIFHESIFLLTNDFLFQGSIRKVMSPLFSSKNLSLCVLFTIVSYLS